MTQRIEDQNTEIKELKEKVTTLMGKITLKFYLYFGRDLGIWINKNSRTLHAYFFSRLAANFAASYFFCFIFFSKIM